MKHKLTSKLVMSLALIIINSCTSTTPSGNGNNTMISANDPAKAQIVSVDRFQDSFGKLFKRSGPAFDTENVSKVLPAPNAPIDMDKYFLVKSLGPKGEKVTYYALDILTDIPAKGWVFVNQSGKMIENQLPIIDALPGDETYNDFVRINEVKVHDGYVANSLSSVDDVNNALKDNKVTVTETTRIANWSVVPAGTIATHKFNGVAVSGYKAWYKKQIANYLRFDTQLQAVNGKVPTSPIIVILNNGKDPSKGFKAETDGQTHNVLGTLPGDASYSSLWIHNVQGKPEGFDSVKDFASALANQSGPLGPTVNCPVVTP